MKLLPFPSCATPRPRAILTRVSKKIIRRDQPMSTKEKHELGNSFFRRLGGPERTRSFQGRLRLSWLKSLPAPLDSRKVPSTARSFDQDLSRPQASGQSSLAVRLVARWVPSGGGAEGG